MCYSLAIKFNILSLSKFNLFLFEFVRMGKEQLQMTDSDKTTVISCFFYSLQVTLTICEDVLNHVTKYFLTYFTLKRYQHYDCKCK